MRLVHYNIYLPKTEPEGSDLNLHLMLRQTALVWLNGVSNHAGSLRSLVRASPISPRFD